MTDDGQLSLPGFVRRVVRRRKPDVVWDAMVATCRCDEHLERGRINAALRLLRSHPDYVRTADHDGVERADELLATEIPLRAALYRRRWPTVELTPTALATNWVRITTPRPPTNATAAYLHNLAKEERDD